jgi:hypothetical protein
MPQILVLFLFLPQFFGLLAEMSCQCLLIRIGPGRLLEIHCADSPFRSSASVNQLIRARLRS